jgi:glucokinase
MSESQLPRNTGGSIWIGVDIGGTKTAVVLSSQPPAIHARIEFPTLPEQGPARALDLIVRNIHRTLDLHQVCKEQLTSIGVSCGGPLDRLAGLIQAPPNLPTWVDVPIRSLLEREFGTTCNLENDANAGAVAEHRFGAGRGTQHMIFLTMGTGLGAGIIADGRLYHGACDLAGEIGHVRLTRLGPAGHNKAGSVEGWASGGGMAQSASQQVAAAIEIGQTTALAAPFASKGLLTAKDVAEAAEAGDELATQIIHRTGTRLGEALAILVDLLNPELIVVGGLGMRLGERLFTPARVAMEKEALAASANACRVVPAMLGEQIGDIAALCVAMGL